MFPKNQFDVGKDLYEVRKQVKGETYMYTPEDGTLLQNMIEKEDKEDYTTCT